MDKGYRHYLSLKVRKRFNSDRHGRTNARGTARPQGVNANAAQSNRPMALVYIA